MAAKTLNKWIELGLFVVSAKDEIKVNDQFHSVLKKQTIGNSTIACSIRQIILAKENNKNFWDIEKNKAADFTRNVAWMLAQDVYSSPKNFTQAEAMGNEQAASSKITFFKNSTRWKPFVSLSTFLGFGHSDSGKSSGGYIIDPTPAIRQTLLELLPKKREVGIKTVLDQLAEIIPVVDGGEYRQMVEANLRKEKWRPPGPGELSMSLSRSLLRMHASGEIRWETKSDAKAQVKILGQSQRVIQTVTHIRRGNMK